MSSIEVNLIYLMGATNAGKSTLMETARKWKKFGTVSVGRMMRAKYPPDHFKGQANPAHTRVEAVEMMMEGVRNCIKDDIYTILIDGQPRDVDQIREIDHVLQAGKLDRDIPEFIQFKQSYVHLFCPAKIRFARALDRDATNFDALYLAAQRLHGDIPELYNVLSVLLADKRDIISVDSSTQESMSAAIDFLCARG